MYPKNIILKAIIHPNAVIQQPFLGSQIWRIKEMIAQISVYPIGEGTSLGRFVRKGVAVIENSGYTYEVGGMSTSVEVPDLDSLFRLVKEIHSAHVAEGARRIVIDLKVDDRRDKEATIASKKGSVTDRAS
ncbi:MAG TPA: MTH1187 family thiamine-binding protein [Deltaproteobacteria bacterium]|nr:MTH1187 family thiamine-binding protein [Deltaproteobacteria bacterium]